MLGQEKINLKDEHQDKLQLHQAVQRNRQKLADTLLLGAKYRIQGDKVLFDDKEIQGVNAKTFRFLGYGYYTDGEKIVYEGEVMPVIKYGSIVLIGVYNEKEGKTHMYIVDKQADLVFWQGQILPGISGKTFQHKKGITFGDGTYFVRNGQIILQDTRSFKIVNG